MYSRKSARPRIEPWGTPALAGYSALTGILNWLHNCH